MTVYGQFCPVSKAAEILFEKWTILILRELLMGTTRFNDFQRAISRISPTLLTKRLKALEENGVIIRKQVSGQRGYEYRLTPAGKELEPLMENIAVWGMRWARGRMSDDELDVELLMREVQRRIQTKNLPDGETVICFGFTDLKKHRSWWVWVDGNEVDLCTEDPGKNVDLYISSNVRTMVEAWQGDIDLIKALASEAIKAHGDRNLIKTMPDWLGLCTYKDVRPMRLKV
ncbi:MAG: HxlR family transcriptional regulator [Nitrosomonas sp.]|nr:MAG: HxlR family transcriptional regulator [Nitrosomonas sp.]